VPAVPSATWTPLPTVGSVPVEVPIEIFAPVPLLAPSAVPETFSSVPVEAVFAVISIAPVPV
jgi:hypothetical protein